MERSHFCGGELPELARIYVQGQRSVADALDLLNMVAHLFEHSTYLAVTPFDQCDFEPGIGGIANQFNLDRSGSYGM